jgi:MOSC domain-containing protein YiiM
VKVQSVNVGLPREVAWDGKTIATGIFKEPVGGRIAARTLNLEGDRQADLNVHGGPHKAVYCYPSEHYAYWNRALGRTLPVAMFGENCTTEGLTEDTVHVGDVLSIGSARFVVSQPRLPCFKLGIRFQSNSIIKRFLASGRSGFYVAVAAEGEIGAGDAIAIVSRDPEAVRIADITRLYVAKSLDSADEAILHRALRVAALPESWKEYFRDRLHA